MEAGRTPNESLGVVEGRWRPREPTNELQRLVGGPLLAFVGRHWLLWAFVDLHWLSLAIVHWWAFVGLARHWLLWAFVNLCWPPLAIIGCCGPSLTCVGLRWPSLAAV